MHQLLTRSPVPTQCVPSFALRQSQAKGMQKAKQEAKAAEPPVPESNGKSPTFRDFDLQELAVPAEAWPAEPTKGKLGYTVTSSNGAVP